MRVAEVLECRNDPRLVRDLETDQSIIGHESDGVVRAGMSNGVAGQLGGNEDDVIYRGVRR